MTTQYDPREIAASIDEMWWPELDQLASNILGAMLGTAEAGGASLELRVSTGKAQGSAPRGDVSLADHWRPRIESASAEDLQDHANGQAPRRTRTQVVLAAVALWETHHRSLRLPGATEGDGMDLDREERITSEYAGYDPHTVAALETARGGWVTAAAVRRCRRANDRHPDTGNPVAKKGEERAAEALRLRYEPDHNGKQRSYRDIARILGCAPSTVMTMLPKEATIDSQAA